MRSSRRHEGHAEAPHRISGRDDDGARSRGEGPQSAEATEVHSTGNEVPEPWSAEELRSGSANANHRGESGHDAESLRRLCCVPCTAGKDAGASIPRGRKRCFLDGGDISTSWPLKLPLTSP